MSKKEERNAAFMFNDGATVGPNAITVGTAIGTVKKIEKIDGPVKLVRFLYYRNNFWFCSKYHKSRLPNIQNID